MRVLKWISLVVFVLLFLHACIVTGFFFSLPLGSDLYQQYLKHNRGPLVRYPVTVYGKIGAPLWKNDTISPGLKEVYRPMLETTVRPHAKGPLKDVPLRVRLRLFDINVVNIAVLACLVLTVVLFLATAGSRERRR
jgi:hypothetical protein